MHIQINDAFNFIPHPTYSDGYSLEGRLFSFGMACKHLIYLPVEPILYFSLGLGSLAIHYSLKDKVKEVSEISFYEIGKSLLISAFIAPIIQIIFIAKAILGIIHPGFYFKPTLLKVYFDELALLAQELGCEEKLGELFKKASANLLEEFSYGRQEYYLNLFEVDLAIITKKLREDQLTKEDKIAILKMFDSYPMEKDDDGSGLSACPPGFGRLLEQICYSLNTPQKEELILPWLIVEHKLAIINQIIMLWDAKKKISALIDPPHFFNIILVKIGKKIGIPDHMIETPRKDHLVDSAALSEKEEIEFLKLFNLKYSKKCTVTYLLERINSQYDGRPGLKNFRNSIIKKLSEIATEKEILESKTEIKDLFKIGDDLAEDPSFYVKWRYFLYPSIDPSDERASDLNEAAILAYAASTGIKF